MADIPISSVQSTDYAGTYTLYTYADGHTETDPVGRPLSREDVQRARLASFSQSKPTQSLGALGAVSSAAPVHVDTARVSASMAALFPALGKAQDAIATLASTGRSTVAALDEHSGMADLGGPVVGPRAGQKQSFTRPAGTDPELPTEVR